MGKTITVKAKVSSIAKDLALGKDRQFLLGKYGKKWGASRTTIDRYIQEAQKEATEIQQATSNELRGNSVEEAKKAFTGEILSKLQKQDILRKIMLGELECEKIIIVGGKAEKIKTKPDQVDIMKAIDLDNKMSGDYAPVKTESEGSITVFQIPDNGRGKKD